MPFGRLSDTFKRTEVLSADHQLRGVLDAMFAFVGVLTTDGVIVDVNRAPLDAMRQTRDELIGTKLVDHMAWSNPPEARQEVARAIAAAAAGESVRLELPVTFPGNRIAPMDVSFAPVRDDAGRVRRVVASGVDVSERSRATSELQRLLRQQEAIASLGSLALRTNDLAAFLDAVVRTVGRVTGCPFCGVLELEPGGGTLVLRAQVGLKPESFTESRIPSGTASQSGYTLATRVPVIVEDLRSETRFTPPRLLLDYGAISGLSVVVAGAEGPYGVLAVYDVKQRVFGFEDVHFVQSAANAVADFIRRTSVEERLSRSERRYRTLASAGTQVVWTTDSSAGNVTILGDPEYIRHYHETWAFENGAPVVHPNDRDTLATAWTTALTDRTRFQAEYRLLRGDGQWRNVVSRGQPVLGDDGSIEEWIGVVVDVTEQRRLQEQLRQAQKMDAIGQLAGGIAHDFNNLLTIICGCSDLLDELTPAVGQQRDLLDDVRDAAERAAALTRQLLAFSRKQVTAPTILDVAHVTHATEKLLRRLIGEDINLVVSGTGRCTARLDRAQIEQVIVNLAINARDAMPQGGTLTIDTRVAESAEPGATGSIAGRHVVLTVSDNGSGMTADVRARIFEPFFTTKGPARGSGLGLATVYGIVTQSGGDISVESEPGNGTVFRIRLPLVEEPPSASAGAAATALPLGSETILIVEDEAGVRNFARHVLERCGYRVLAAGDGAEAVRLARDHDGPIDLLVSDIVMPGAGGRVVAEQVSGIRQGVRVLFVSGYAADAILRHGIQQSEVSFLGKPFLPHQLAEKVRQVLDGRDGQNGARLDARG